MRLKVDNYKLGRTILVYMLLLPFINWWKMYFISLFKWKKAPTRELIKETNWSETRKKLEKQGIKIDSYWTFGRYDAINIIEAPSEKEAMKVLLQFQDLVESETLTAVPREEAIKLL